jgi:hypothetical protein
MPFVNITNHPSSKWSADQLAAACELGGEVVDLPFPNVPPLATSQDVSATADLLAAQVPDGAVGMVSGEWTLTFALATRLRRRGIALYVACSDRRVIETVEDGVTKKTAVFEFVRFRAIE